MRPCGDLVGRTVTSQWNDSAQEVRSGVCGGIGRVHVGIDRPGLHVIDRDLPRGQLARPGPREAGDGELARRVHAGTRKWHRSPTMLPILMIRAAIRQAIDRLLRDQKQRLHVDVERLVKSSSVDSASDLGM